MVLLQVSIKILLLYRIMTLTVGYNKNINRYNAMFLVAVLDLQRSKYSFGRKYKRNLSSTKIKLPTKDNSPDWLLMENYIKSITYGDRI